MIMQLIAAVIGTVTFCILFEVPRRYYPMCGFIGGAGWAVYLLAGQLVSTATACLFATMVIIFLSRLAAVLEKCPATIFLIAGIFPLVPGGSVYWMAYYMVKSRPYLALNYGYTAVKFAAAIVIGIVVIFEIPQTLFTRIADLPGIRRLKVH